MDRKAASHRKAALNRTSTDHAHKPACRSNLRSAAGCELISSSARDDKNPFSTTIDPIPITRKNGRRSSYSAHPQVHPQPPACPQADGRVSLLLRPHPARAPMLHLPPTLDCSTLRLCGNEKQEEGSVSIASLRHSTLRCRAKEKSKQNLLRNLRHLVSHGQKAQDSNQVDGRRSVGSRHSLISSILRSTRTD